MSDDVRDLRGREPEVRQRHLAKRSRVAIDPGDRDRVDGGRRGAEASDVERTQAQPVQREPSRRQLQVRRLNPFGDGLAKLDIGDRQNRGGGAVDGQVGDVDFEVLEAWQPDITEADDELRTVEVFSARVVDHVAWQLDVQVPIEFHVVGDGDDEVA